MAIGKHLMDAMAKMASSGIRWFGGGPGVNAQRRERETMSRRMRKAAKRRMALGLCPIDERNPTGIGNRRHRRYAETHGVTALREKLKSGATN